MRTLRILLTGVVVAGLAVDAYVHLNLASTFDPIKATVSQGQLFRLEAVAAIVAAILLLVRPRRWTAALAAVVAGGGLVAVVLYAVVDVGAVGPLPNMYDPTWSTQKTLSAVAEAAAAIGALLLVAIGPRQPASEPESVLAPVA